MLVRSRKMRSIMYHVYYCLVGLFRRALEKIVIIMLVKLSEL